MATFLLDNGFIIDAINNKKSRRQFLRDLVSAGNTLACCAINVTEIYAGVLPAEEHSTAAFLSSLEYYPVNFPAARLAGSN